MNHGRHRYCQVIYVMSVIKGLQRRYRRMRRRRKVGRAYDMALEIARYLKTGSTVLDVGCGNGFIAHHLKSILRSGVVGLDVGLSTDATIDYVKFDGRHFPVQCQTFDVVLLCYVLHHAQDARLVLEEARRVLRATGVVVVYEDNPGSQWDRAICWSHAQQWKGRTGPCTFQNGADWNTLFKLSGFDPVAERRLSRWRNLAHPVSRNFFVIKVAENRRRFETKLRLEMSPSAVQKEVRVGT